MTDQQLDLDGLERLAKAVKTGPWECRFRFGRKTTVVGRQRFPICDTATAPYAEANARREEATAAYIAAANPATILALISQAREAERMRGALEWARVFLTEQWPTPETRIERALKIINQAAPEQPALAPATGGGE